MVKDIEVVDKFLILAAAQCSGTFGTVEFIGPVMCLKTDCGDQMFLKEHGIWYARYKGIDYVDGDIESVIRMAMKRV